MNILQLLVQKNIITKDQASKLQEEARTTGQKPEELLISQKIVDETFLFNLKSEALKMPLNRLDTREIPLKILELIPEDSARYYRFIPFAQRGNVLEVGMVYPEDLRAQEALKFLARQGNFSYRVSLVTPSTFEEVMKRYRNLRGEVQKALAELEKEIEGAKKGGGGVIAERLVEEAPVTKMVAVILRTAVEGGASDIHIEPTRENVRVRFRFLGELHSSIFLPLQVHPSVIARVKILSNLKIDETRIPQDGRFSAPIEGRNVDFRVATFPTALGEKVAIRVLDPLKSVTSFNELGLEGSNLEKVKEAMKKPYGLILATGPTGSGKTTTLYAILRTLNRENVNIVSLEDPVEYLIEGVNQSQVRPEIGYDFAQGLRQVLRQDPNVIMVGEVRDQETAFLVIHAALTGHIVLSTLHTNNAIGVIPRLIDMGVDRYLIPATLSIAIAQRLVRKLCEVCRERIRLSKAMRDLMMRDLENAGPDVKKRTAHLLQGGGKDVMVYKAQGCRRCGGTGYSGRIGIFEVLSMSDELSDIILQEPSEAKIREETKRAGMTTMRQDGILKVLDGVTTMEEIMRVTAE